MRNVPENRLGDVRDDDYLFRESDEGDETENDATEEESEEEPREEDDDLIDTEEGK